MGDAVPDPLLTFRDPRGEKSGKTLSNGAWAELVRRAGSAGVLLHGAPGTPAELGESPLRSARPGRRPDDALKLA